MSRKKKSHSAPATQNERNETLLERYRALLSEVEFKKLEAETTQPLPTTIRINLLKHQTQEMTGRLQQLYGWQMERIPFCPSGFGVESGTVTPSQTIEHRMGDFYIQEAASMLPAELFDFSNTPQPLILDMAASPGGKTIHLADLSRDNGLIIANDASRARLPALHVVLRKWGAIHQAVTCLPGELFAHATREWFDYVLLDAPCSMEGLRAAASHKMRAISPKERERLAMRQQKLLASALAAVKTGGQVVYSTCTLAAEENEAVLAAVMDEYPNAFQVDALQQKLPVPAPGLDKYGETKYPDSMRNSFRLWPHVCHTAGFFAARLTKLKDIPPGHSSQPLLINWRAPRLLAEKEFRTISILLLDQYGFDFNSLMEKQNLAVGQDNNELRLIPLRYLNEFSGLPCTSIGLRLGERIGDEFIPTHEFVARFGQSIKSSKVQLDEELLKQWLRGEDLRPYSAPALPKGRVVVVTDGIGRNLGRGKILSNQLKNLLPNRLF